MMITKDKAFGYVTSAGRVLVFRHVDFPQAGLQVPAGSILPGESPEVAAVREVMEETGLCSFATVAPVGITEFDASPWGKNELHRRHFFHLTVNESVSERWRHCEVNASNQQGVAIAFELFWLPIEVAARRLDFGHGALLRAIDTRA